MLRKEPTERPSSREVLGFLNTHAGFPNTASMPHPIVQRPSGSLTPMHLDANTLSRATGQGPPTRRRLTYLSAGVFAVLVLGLSAVGLLTRSRWQGEAVSKAGGGTPAPQATIRWTLKSTPAGAEVVRQADNHVLGYTPWNQEQPRSDGTEVLLLRHPGYADQTVNLDRSGSRELSLTLTALPAPPPTASAGGEERAPRTRSSGGKGGDREKRRHSSKVTNADIPLIK